MTDSKHSHAILGLLLVAGTFFLYACSENPVQPASETQTLSPNVESDDAPVAEPRSLDAFAVSKVGRYCTIVLSMG